MIRELIASGKGLSKFKEFIKAQGGSTSWIGKRALTKAEQVFTAVSTDGGYITRIDGRASVKSPWKWAPVGPGKKTPSSPWSASASLKSSTIPCGPAKLIHLIRKERRRYDDSCSARRRPYHRNRRTGCRAGTCRQRHHLIKGREKALYRF